MTEATTVADREVAEFLHAVSGPPGALDAWLQVNGEAELRAHIMAVVTGAERTIIALQTGCTQWQVSSRNLRDKLDEALGLLHAVHQTDLPGPLASSIAKFLVGRQP